MEDAVEALKIGFAVLVFVIALSVAFSSLTQAKQVSDTVLEMTSSTYLDEYEFANTAPGDGRVVGIETVIPTLYRYSKEKYSVDIVENNKLKEKFDIDTERKVYSNSKDVNADIKNLYRDSGGISWLGNTEIDIATRVDGAVSGRDKTINNMNYDSNISIYDWRNSTFVETFTESDQSTLKEGDDGSSVIKIAGTKKMFITFTKQ